MKHFGWMAASLLSMTAGAQHTPRHIVATEPISIESPQGTAPMLPYRLWVDYNDGKGEYRQVRWLNASTDTEEKLASSDHQAGETYPVRGFITGDNATAAGYPVEATVRITDQLTPIPPRKPLAAPLPLNQVRLTGDNLLTHNRDLDLEQLLSLDVTQQLYNYRDTYGLPTEGYTPSDGWDSPTTKLKGHGTGHYLSALALAYASSNRSEQREKLLGLIQRMVKELRACQERTFVFDPQLGRYREARDLAPDEELRTMTGSWADFDRYKQDYSHYGYGYLNAIPAQHCVLIERYAPYNNETGVWAPYYTIHKQLAGLIDIATWVDHPQTAQLALTIARDMGLWVWNRLHYRTYVKCEGTQEERRQRPGNRYEMWNMYIAGEVGGIAESLSRLAEMTSDQEQRRRLIEAAGYFDSPAFFDPLARNIDAIRTRHANQHIPMVVGALRSYRTNGNPYYFRLASHFWQLIQGRYRYAMGGVGNGEMFRQPYTQMMSLCTNASRWNGVTTPEPTLNETCCAYNLAKLTKELNGYTPNQAAFMDYYERLLYNQIVGSINPHRYGVTYQYAVGLNASKPFGNETPQSSCCGGTGAENHLKYQEAAYFANDSTLWVALYLPTEVDWKAKGIRFTQDCEWPAEQSSIRIVGGGARFEMRLRVPYWATEGFSIKLNGETLDIATQPGSYAVIPYRKWRRNDVVEVTMPYTKHIDFAPDKMQLAVGKDGQETFQPCWTGALMAGPLVMTTTGISTWQEAVLNVKSDLSNITLERNQTDEDASSHRLPCILSAGGHRFIPDYAAHDNTTHYLRLHIETAPNSQLPAGVQHLIASIPTSDKSALQELMQDAIQRIKSQQTWLQLTTKVPDYAPWAPNGFKRMKEQYDRCAKLYKQQDGDLQQEEIDRQASQLSAALSSMRPGNLAEPEELQTLQQKLEQAKRNPRPSAQLCEAIRHAEMVVRYVSDGSGTSDMIVKAEQLLDTQLRPVKP